MEANLLSNDGLFFSNLLLRAELLAVLGILNQVCAQTGYRDPDRISLNERFYAQRRVELEADFRRLEDAAPALAARLHEQYEQARKHLGDARS